MINSSFVCNVPVWKFMLLEDERLPLVKKKRSNIRLMCLIRIHNIVCSVWSVINRGFYYVVQSTIPPFNAFSIIVLWFVHLFSNIRLIFNIFLMNAHNVYDLVSDQFWTVWILIGDTFSLDMHTYICVLLINYFFLPL